MSPKFRINPVLKYTKCHISTNLSNFLKLCSLYCKKLFALAPTNRRFAEKKIGLVGTLVPGQCGIHGNTHADSLPKGEASLPTAMVVCPFPQLSPNL